MNVNLPDAEVPIDPLNQEALSSRVYQSLRLQVMRGRFRPSEKLKLRDLAAELGVSATPVREALARLVSENALEQVDRRSVRVPVLSERTFREVTELRIDLEGRAAQQAAERATAQDIEYLRALQDRHASARMAGHVQDIIVTNEQFHKQICEISQMKVLTCLVDGLWLRCGPVLRFIAELKPLYDLDQHPHLDIIHGLSRRDGTLAKFAMQRDIMTFSQTAIRYIWENDNHA